MEAGSRDFDMPMGTEEATTDGSEASAAAILIFLTRSHFSGFELVSFNGMTNEDLRNAFFVDSRTMSINQPVSTQNVVDSMSRQQNSLD